MFRTVTDLVTIYWTVSNQYRKSTVPLPPLCYPALVSTVPVLALRMGNMRERGGGAGFIVAFPVSFDHKPRH